MCKCIFLHAVTIDTSVNGTIRSRKVFLTYIFHFSSHVDTVCKKANQRLYLLRKLKSFDVDRLILKTVYISLVESILTFNTIA
jgi:hypothetical protein